MLTKEEIKTLCDYDTKLQQWACTLFAEMYVIMHNHREVDKAVYDVLFEKTQEFNRLIIFSKLDEVKQQAKQENKLHG